MATRLSGRVRRLEQTRGGCAVCRGKGKVVLGYSTKRDMLPGNYADIRGESALLIVEAGQPHDPASTTG